MTNKDFGPGGLLAPPEVAFIDVEKMKFSER